MLQSRLLVVCALVRMGIIAENDTLFSGDENVAGTRNETWNVALRGATEATATCTGNYRYNCASKPSCCDPSSTCFQKMDGYAYCLKSCEPGVHGTDQPKYQTPWSCSRLGVNPPSPLLVPPASSSPPHGCTDAYSHNCMHNPVCCDPSLTCYAKDDFAAFCLRSCSPGINPHDPPQFQTPWTCARVGAGPAPPAPPAPSPAQPGCAAASENCHDNPVCCDSSMACYEKDDWYARCRASCTPGIQKSDPWRFRTPWACSRLTPGPAAPPNPLLQLPSSADVLTFHMYRAQGPTAYPPENVNAGNLAGVMWYLQHEVVSGDYGEGNKFGITRILRLKLQTKAPQPLADKGMNFGVRVAFDSGRCTGPSCELSWNNYGYNVGCNNLGDYPYPKYSTHYQGGIWYSLPGPCPSTEYQDKTAECKLQEPGGLCAGTPTGTGNCTWSYEDAGEISLEELYKGTDHSSFWENPHNDAANEERVQAAKAVFASKYGDELTDPACDFNFTGFYA